MFWTKRCNLFSIGDILWRRKGGCLAFAHASRRTSSCICLSISTVFLFPLYLYFYCICISVTERSWVARLWTCEKPIILLYFSALELPWWSPVLLVITLLFHPVLEYMYFFSSVHTSLRWPMVHDGRSGGVSSSGTHSPLASPFCFVIWGGAGMGCGPWGVVHWCWWPCTCTWSGAGALLHTLSKHAYGPRGCEKG